MKLPTRPEGVAVYRDCKDGCRNREYDMGELLVEKKWQSVRAASPCIRGAEEKVLGLVQLTI